MTRQDLIDFCLTLPNTFEDYPFDSIAAAGVWTVMRHRANKKGFAHIYERNDRLCINLKCDPMEAEFLRNAYKDVEAGYHMNKTHWNTVYPDGDMPEEELHRMIANSYDLIKPKMKSGDKKDG